MPRPMAELQRIEAVLTRTPPGGGEPTIIGYQTRPAPGNRQEGVPGYLHYFMAPDRLAATPAPEG